MPWRKIEIEKLKGDRNIIFGLPKNIYGVYKICCEKEIGRIKGKSNILYIGKGNIRNRIVALLDVYLKKTGRVHTAKKDLERIIFKEGFTITAEYRVMKDKEEAKQLESVLISQYCANHIEPPPLNHTRK